MESPELPCCPQCKQFEVAFVWEAHGMRRTVSPICGACEWDLYLNANVSEDGRYFIKQYEQRYKHIYVRVLSERKTFP